jgi:hypothetical protein
LKKVALVACDHGFGHTKRCYIYGMELAKNKLEVSLFAREDGLRKFSQIYGTMPNLHLIPFRTQSCPLNSKKQWMQWLNNLPNLDTFQCIVSDNLPEILELRQDAFLSGSFLWHLDLPDIDQEYKAHCEALIAQYRPIHLAADFFVSDELRSRSQIVSLGLIGKVKPDEPKANFREGALLISGGRNTILKAELIAFVKKLILNKEKPNFSKVWVDSNLLPENYPNWMGEATFNEDMYRSLSVALIRPGVGTVTDCLRNRVFILAVAEQENIEMITNTEALEKSHLGVSLQTSILVESTLESNLNKAYTVFLTQKKSVYFDGEVQFTDFIQKNLKLK